MGKLQKRKSKRGKLNNINTIPQSTIENIIIDLSAGIDKKDISSKYGLKTDVIYRIFNKHHSKILDIKNSIQYNQLQDDAPNNDNEKCQITLSNIQIPEHSCISDKSSIIVLNESSRISNTPDKNSIITISSDLLAIPIELNKYIENAINALTSCSIDENEISSVRIPVLSNVYLGMIKGRHNMPVSKFIFQSVSKDLMFDYDTQYDIAKEIILKEIKFIDGESQNVLVVYATGLTCALATIIKVCDDFKINLILMHHNSATRKYEAQTIFNHFYHTDNVCPDILKTISRRKLYTYGCTAKEFVNNKGGYEIAETHLNINHDAMYRDVTLFIDKISAWKYYINLIEHKNESVVISFNTIKLDNDKYIKTSTLSTSSCNKR